MTTAISPSSGQRAGDLARRLKAARSVRELTVEQVADRAGIQPNYLRYLESTTALPTTACLRNLAVALGTSVDKLLGAGGSR